MKISVKKRIDVDEFVGIKKSARKFARSRKIGWRLCFGHRGRTTSENLGVVGVSRALQSRALARPYVGTIVARKIAAIRFSNGVIFVKKAVSTKQVIVRFHN